MRKYEYEELIGNNPQIEIEHDIMEVETEEYDDVGLPNRIKNKLNKSSCDRQSRDINEK